MNTNRANKRPGVDAGCRVLFAFQSARPRATQAIERRSDVEQVWMQIYDLDEGDWPFSENVLIFGQAPISELRRLSQSLEPSEISELQMDWVPSRVENLSGRSYINLWWD